MNLNPVPSLPTEQSIIGIPGGGGGNINNYDLSYFARALHTIKRAQTHVKSTVKIKLSSSEINFIALLSISRYTYNNEYILITILIRKILLWIAFYRFHWNNFFVFHILFSEDFRKPNFQWGISHAYCILHIACVVHPKDAIFALLFKKNVKSTITLPVLIWYQDKLLELSKNKSFQIIFIYLF